MRVIHPFERPRRIERSETDTDDQPGDGIGAVPTGFREIDTALGNGLQPGTLTVIAGFTGSGVTGLATHIAKQLVTEVGAAANIMSLDTTRDRLEHRIRAATDPPAETSFVVGRRELYEGRMRIYGTHTRQPRAILQNLTLELWTSEPRANLIVIDSLNMVGVDGDDLSFPRSPKTHSAVMVDFCRHLKGIALDENIAIIATTTFAVKAGIGMERTDWVEHLPSVGPITAAADNVLLLYRPDMWDYSTPRAGEIDLVLAKGAREPKHCFAAHQIGRGIFKDFPSSPQSDPK